MNKPVLLLSALALSGLGSGCVGTGPNTQQGAVTGGALGAIAGAVIGHNSRGGDALGGTVGALAGGAIGNSVDHQQGTVYGYPDNRGYRRVRVEQAPPPPAYSEPISAPPAPNAIWIPGYWSYDGRGYAWVKGFWEIPPPNAHAYVAAHWERQGDRDVYVAASWR
jgi:hypothetical protein